MTIPQQENQAQNAPLQDKPSDKELNFRALEAKFQRELLAERQARIELENRLKQNQTQQLHEEETETDEPYVAPKQLNKKLNQFGQSTKSEIQKAMEMAKSQAKEELKQEMFLEKNSDFYQIMENENLLNDFSQKMPGLAQSILSMPNTFERQKLVYENIKALGLHKPAQKEPSVQEKIDQNKRSPYYQPSGIGTAPYNQVGDFSATGQKQAYAKLQELKNRLRL